MSTRVEIPTELADQVLAALSDAVVAVDRQGCVTCWSGAAERLLGMPAATALGRPITSLFPGFSRNDPEELLTLGGADRLEAVRRLGPGGALLALTSTLVRDGPGAVIGAVSLVRPMGGWLETAVAAHAHAGNRAGHSPCHQ